MPAEKLKLRRSWRPHGRRPRRMLFSQRKRRTLDLSPRTPNKL